MLIPQIAPVNNGVERSDAQAFVAVKNSAATALIRGETVVWDVVTDADGIGVAYPATASLDSPAGICAEDIAVNGYGLVQCYGHCEYADVAGGAISAGEALKMADGATRLVVQTTTEALGAGLCSQRFVSQFAYTTATGTLTNQTVFIYCM